MHIETKQYHHKFTEKFHVKKGLNSSFGFMPHTSAFFHLPIRHRVLILSSMPALELNMADHEHTIKCFSSF